MKNLKVNVAYSDDEVNYNVCESKSARVLFEKEIWRIDEVCAYTHYAKSTIYNLAARGEIPFRSRGKRKMLVFVPSEIVAWLKGEL